MFQRSTFTLFVARDEKSSERVVASQPALQLTDKCFCSFSRRVLISTVKSRFNERPPTVHFDSLTRDFTLNRDFLM